MARFTFFLALIAAAVQSSPTPDIVERDLYKGKLDDVLCKKVNVIITVLKAYKATPFCSSYLNIPAVTSTSTAKQTTVTTVKVTATVTAPQKVIKVTSTTTVTNRGSTSYTFLPGNPTAHRWGVEVEARNVKPDWLKDFKDDIVSSGCKCLDIPIKTVYAGTTTTKATSTATSTTTVTTTPSTTVTVWSTSTVSGYSTTIYPCATPLPTLIPTVPYGDAVTSQDLGISNTRFTLDDPKGASAEACCNTCYFGIPNCVQAFWYSYQGCVVQQAFNPGSGKGVSTSCPSGLFEGLQYVRDNSPAFRSTGDFAGPCGVQYLNL